MGLLGKIVKRQGAEDSEDLDFDDEMVDSLDMPGEEGSSRRGMLSKVLKWRRKGETEDAEGAEEADRDEDPGNAEDLAAPEEDSPVQVVRLEGIPDVHPVGDSNTVMGPAQEQTGPATGSAASTVPGAGPSPGSGSQPAESSPSAEGTTPVDLAPVTATEVDTTEDSSSPNSDDLSLSLQDIFGEQEVVDESLRDLADFVEDTLAQGLAGELQEFLEELEARQK